MEIIFKTSLIILIGYVILIEYRIISIRKELYHIKKFLYNIEDNKVCDCNNPEKEKYVYKDIHGTIRCYECNRRINPKELNEK